MAINIETHQDLQVALTRQQQQLATLEQQLAELRTSEGIFRSLTENSVDLISRHTRDGRCLYMSPACKHILGYEPAEFIGQTQDALFHPQDLAEVKKAQAHSIIASDITTFAYRARRKDGSYVWLETTNRSIRDEHTGEVQEIHSISRDITARKGAETALRQSEQKLALHIQQTPMAYIEWNLQFEVTQWNPAAEAVFGFSKQEALGRHAAGLIVPDEFKRVVEQVWTDLLSQRGGSRSTNDNLTKSGQVISCEWYNTPLIDETGHVLGVASLIQDVTERKQAEAALKESQQFVEQITVAIPGLVYVYDLHEQRNVYANRQMADLLGYTAEEVQAMGAAMLPTIMHPDDLPIILANQQSMLSAKDGEVFEAEFRIKHASGEWRWLESHETIFKRDVVGRPLQTLGYAQDVTERKQSQAALRENEARVQRITANALGMMYQFVLHPDGRIEWPFVSEGSRDIYEVTPEQIQQQPLLPVQMIHADDIGEFQRSVGESAQTLQPWMWEGRIVMPDGKTKWLQGASWPERRADGATTWDGLLLDITARRKAENALRASEERLRTVIANVPLILFAFDNNGIFTLSEGKGLQAVGLAPGQVVGLSVFDVYRDIPAVAADAKRALTGELFSTIVDVGETVFETWYAPVHDEHGIFSGVIGVSTDITERTKAEAEARWLQDEIIRMQASTLAELSTPIIPISDKIVVMPLVGALDSKRVQQVLESVLHGVESSRAQFAILDITGVAVVDTQVANVLIQAARAVALLGAQVVLTGIRPEVAQTLVGLGVNLGTIVTRSSLQSGIAYAESVMG